MYSFDFDYQAVLRRHAQCPWGLKFIRGRYPGNDRSCFVLACSSCAAEYNGRLEVSGLAPIMANMIKAGDEVRDVNGHCQYDVIIHFLQDCTHRALFLTLRRRAWAEHEMPAWLMQAIRNQRVEEADSSDAETVADLSAEEPVDTWLRDDADVDMLSSYTFSCMREKKEQCWPPPPPTFIGEKSKQERKSNDGYKQTFQIVQESSPLFLSPGKDVWTQEVKRYESVEVLERIGAWTKVKRANGFAGWIPNSCLPPSLPLRDPPKCMVKSCLAFSAGGANGQKRNV